MQILSDESFRKRSGTTTYDPKFVELVTKIQRYWRQQQRRKELKKRIKKMKAKSQVARELLVTEKAYCEHLGDVITKIV